MQILPVVSDPSLDSLPGAAAALAESESERLAALDRLDVLDTPREEAFDRIARLARKVFNVPMAAVSFIDAHRQWYKANDGLVGDQHPREHSFCRHLVETGKALVVPDATKDERFAESPFVTGSGIRFYAGLPLRSADGHNIGSICIVDTKPREFGEAQLDLLNDLAHISMDELDLRLTAVKDSLTGVLTRRRFKEEAARSVALAQRHHQDLAIVAFDLDRFKHINDTFGHAAGDAVLVGAAEAARSVLRITDLIGRLGGEEFAVLLPSTALGGAMEVAEKIRKAVGALRFTFGEQEAGIATSVGVAALDPSTRDAETLLVHADKALYEAKNAGRNRVVAYRAPAPAATETTRRRVLKGGKVVFNAGRSSIDCTVRSLSDQGAGIDISSSLGVPKHFNLVIDADRFDKPARIVSQTERHIELEFA
jgi:diguanylate cyclase (GGDEF)-like protein